ncbi:GNAT family N-acetyltransferase [Streptomyces sp. NPDC051569]|uniref:GNAT family N-acetyltransferase n=1 Tax=Streptomyces sp. NPDC051569 TaxID=3365661 RepID=UPI00379E64D1
MSEASDRRLPPPAVVRGYGLRLRAWRTGDEAALLRAYNDAEFLHWNTPLNSLTTEAEAALAFGRYAEGRERGDLAQFCVVGGEEERGEEETVLGHVGLRLIDFRMRSADVGYWVLPEARGRGVARRALELCTRWAFDEVGLHRIQLGHALGHEISCRVAERCGYRAEGTLRDGMFAAGTLNAFRDVHRHARLATDPPSAYPPSAYPPSADPPPADPPSGATPSGATPERP